MQEDIRVVRRRVLARGYAVLHETVFEQRRRDGSWQTLTRDVLQRGAAAAVLPCDPVRGMVLLTRQFRLPAHEAGHGAPLIEAIAGMLDGREAEAAITREATEEAGLTLRGLRRVMTVFTSPGVLTETMALFVARYDAADRTASGGGLAEEGEDIEVLELPLDVALAMIGRGEIVDAKTVILLQHAQLAGLCGSSPGG